MPYHSVSHSLMIRASYSASFFIVVNVKTIVYYKGCPVNGVRISSTPQSSLDDDSYVFNSHVFALFHGF